MEEDATAGYSGEAFAERASPVDHSLNYEAVGPLADGVSRPRENKA